MAKAEKRTEVVRTHNYVLTLSEDEAQTLAVILANVGGDPDTTPRKHSDAVSHALGKQGVKPYNSAIRRQAKGSIMFNAPGETDNLFGQTPFGPNLFLR